MAADRYAVIDGDGRVINVIMWDAYSAPLYNVSRDSRALVALRSGEVVEMGAVFDGTQFVTEPVVVDIAVVKAECTAQVEAAFRHLQLSIFVGPAERETMRTAALAAVAQVREAASDIAARRAVVACITSMRAVAEGNK